MSRDTKRQFYGETSPQMSHLQCHRDVLDVLTDAQIETIATSLADLLVAEWKAQHSTHPGGSNPHGGRTIESDTYATSSTYDPDPQDHGPGPTPTPTGRGTLSLVPGRLKTVQQETDSV